MEKIILHLFLLFSVGLFPLNMEGIYESQFGKTYESDSFEWNMWDPNYYLEMRMYGNPIYNSDFYIKFYADKDYQQSEQALVVLAEGHIGFRQEKNGKGFSTTLFTRESRHYWLDGFMLGRKEISNGDRSRSQRYRS